MFSPGNLLLLSFLACMCQIILSGDYASKFYLALLSKGAVYLILTIFSNPLSLGRILKIDHSSESY